MQTKRDKMRGAVAERTRANSQRDLAIGLARDSWGVTRMVAKVLREEVNSRISAVVDSIKKELTPSTELIAGLKVSPSDESVAKLKKELGLSDDQIKLITASLSLSDESVAHIKSSLTLSDELVKKISEMLAERACGTEEKKVEEGLMALTDLDSRRREIQSHLV